MPAAAVPFWISGPRAEGATPLSSFTLTLGFFSLIQSDVIPPSFSASCAYFFLGGPSQVQAGRFAIDVVAENPLYAPVEVFLEDLFDQFVAL